MAPLAVLKLGVEFARLAWDFEYVNGGHNWPGQAIRPGSADVAFWPIVAWLQAPLARWIWAVTAIAALAWLIILLVRESTASTRLERLFVGLMLLSINGTGASIGYGQLVLQLLPALLAGLLLLHRARRSLRDDLVATGLLIITLLKPLIALPFLWIALLVPGRLRPAALLGVGYVALVLCAAIFQKPPLWLLQQGWELGRSTGVDRGYANLHTWLTEAGLATWALPASLLVLMAQGFWTYRNRHADLWLLLGVAALTARLWTHHLVTDDVLIVFPMIALFRIAKRCQGVDGRDLAAGALLAMTVVVMAAPGRLLQLSAPWGFVFTASHAIVWIGALLFLLDQARRDARQAAIPRRFLYGGVHSAGRLLAMGWLAITFPRRLACCISAIVGIGLTSLTFYPGYMSSDSFSHLRQARNLYFSDWHPPAMGLVWAVMDRVVPGPFGMLLFQNLIFWTGLALVAYLTRLPWAVASFLVLACGLLPPIFALLGTVWKDVGMAAALLLAFGAFLYAGHHASRLASVLGLLALLYASALRYNAAPAVLPLALWGGFLFNRLSPRRTPFNLLPPFCFGLLAFAAVSTSAHAWNLLAARERLQPIQQILLHDLTAISVKTAAVATPSYLGQDGEPITVEHLRCLYSPGGVHQLFSQCSSRLRQTADDHEISELKHLWLRAVWSHPGSYLAHRIDVFRTQLAITEEPVCYPYHDGIVQNDLGIVFYGSPLNTAVMQTLRSAAHDTPLFRGWIYLGLTSVLLLLNAKLRRPGRVPTLVLGASGLLYGLAYLGVATTCDFRMHWWTVVSTVVLVMLTLSRLWPAGRAGGLDG
jgi:hypothetical protein